MTEVRARLQERIAEVVRRQEELMGAQGEMAAQLAGVGRDVEHTRGQVGQVGAGHVCRLPACCPVGQWAGQPRKECSIRLLQPASKAGPGACLVPTVVTSPVRTLPCLPATAC